MKKISFFLLTAMLFIFIHQADACVGRTLYIGTLNSPHEMLLSELLSVLINERTGTTVLIKDYKDSEELYNAIKKNEVGITIENTDRAMQILGRPKEENPEKAYNILKEAFKNNLNLVWLKPFGILTAGEGGKKHYYGPVITADVLTNFPALPRVINKLSGVVNEDTFSKLVKAVLSGEKPKKVARDFLKARKLI
jgi:glycine betaine/choline ABC-type transport system substrate-binding protein